MRHGMADATPDRRGGAARPGGSAPAGGGQAVDQGRPQDEFTASDELSAADVAGYLAGGLSRTPGLGAAIRRRFRFWCILAVVGLLIGIGLHKVRPPAHKAQASVLLAYSTGSNASDEVLTEMALAQSQSVGRLALRHLGLTQSVSSFLSGYTVTDPTDQVLLITVSSKSSDLAVRQANAIATAFLQLRNGELIAQQKQLVQSLDREVTKARQQVQAIKDQITTESALPPSAARRAKLDSLQSQRQQAAATLTGLSAAALNAQVNGQTSTSSVVKKSRVLNSAVAIPLSKLRSPVAYAILGLIAGLIIGMAIVVIQALISDRLRRREDVAAVLGAPVSLSVGRVRVGRSAGLGAAEDPPVRQIVGHLREALPRQAKRAALGVVPVDPDSERAAAVAIVALAVSCAKQGRRVMLADLSAGQSVARLLEAGDRDPGVAMLNVDGAQLALAITAQDELMPRGPVGQEGRSGRLAEDLASAYDSADLLLSLVTLDPSHGSDYLATWAATAVAVVTAGVPSATRIHAVGQLIKLAGIPVHSAVLIGADKGDESLGLVPAGDGDGVPADSARPGGRSGEGESASPAENHRGQAESDLVIASDRNRQRRSQSSNIS